VEPEETEKESNRKIEEMEDEREEER